MGPLALNRTEAAAAAAAAAAVAAVLVLQKQQALNHTESVAAAPAVLHTVAAETHPVQRIVAAAGWLLATAASEPTTAT